MQSMIKLFPPHGVMPIIPTPLQMPAVWNANVQESEQAFKNTSSVKESRSSRSHSKHHSLSRERSRSKSKSKSKHRHHKHKNEDKSKGMPNRNRNCDSKNDASPLVFTPTVIFKSKRKSTVLTRQLHL